MAASSKSKKIAKNIAEELKHEVLGPPERKPAPAKRGTMDVILGRFPKQPEISGEESPIVEAMLQTSESEKEAEKPKIKAPDKLDAEITRHRRERLQKDQERLKALEESIPASEKDKEKTDPNATILPSSPRKGPMGLGGKLGKKGIEKLRKRN